MGKTLEIRQKKKKKDDKNDEFLASPSKLKSVKIEKNENESSDQNIKSPSQKFVIPTKRTFKFSQAFVSSNEEESSELEDSSEEEEEKKVQQNANYAKNSDEENEKEKNLSMKLLQNGGIHENKYFQKKSVPVNNLNEPTKQKLLEDFPSGDMLSDVKTSDEFFYVDAGFEKKNKKKVDTGFEALLLDISKEQTKKNAKKKKKKPVKEKLTDAVSESKEVLDDGLDIEEKQHFDVKDLKEIVENKTTVSKGEDETEGLPNESAQKMSKSKLKRLKKKGLIKEETAEQVLYKKNNVILPTPDKVKTESNKPEAGGAMKGKQMSVAARLAQQRLQILKAERQKAEEEMLKQKKEEERIQRELEEKEKKEAEEKELLRKLRQEKKQRLKQEGKLLSATAKERLRKTQILREQFKSSINLEATLQMQEDSKRSTKAVQDKKKKQRVKKTTQEVVEVPEPPLNKDESTLIQTKSLPTPSEDKFSVDNQKEKTNDYQRSHSNTRQLSSNSSTFSWEISSLESGDDTSELKQRHKRLPAKVFSLDHNVIPSVPKNDFQETKVTGLPQSSVTEAQIGDKKLQDVKKTYTKELMQSAELRSPICCILGHVDTGKTKLLDKIRHTNIQLEEAGGITQQIGATFFPNDALWEQCKKVDPHLNIRVPGLLIIDTPGHESFNNLRARGSSLCDIAILVVDLMHGMEPQTRESLELLRARKCPFLVALNKIDRLYNWKSQDWLEVQSSLQRQSESTHDEFVKRSNAALLQLTECGLNCDLWWKVKNQRTTVSVVPTSALTGEGIPDLLYLLVKLTQDVITRALVFNEEFQCIILEVKNIEGLGTTIDVVLVSGTLHENDKIIVCGMTGPIVTTIRALLTPQPMRELRVKGEYIHHKQIRAAMGVKIAAPNLEEAVSGTAVLLATDKTDSDIEKLQEDVMSDINSIFKSVDRSGIGVYVMASTLGSLEALLQFLQQSNIPVFAVNIGNVNKIDVKKASVIKEKGKPELCCILAFDVKVDVEAQKEAQMLGVKICTADIIYHLFDNFNAHVTQCQEELKREKQAEVVFPCILTIFPHCIFNKKDPIVLGVKVESGILRVGTPICIPEKDKLVIGRVVSLEQNKKTLEQAKKGDELAVKILGDPAIAFGRHFDSTHKLCSRLTRDSIDCLKTYFKDELSKDDWKAVREIKRLLSII